MWWPVTKAKWKSAIGSGVRESAIASLKLRYYNTARYIHVEKLLLKWGFVKVQKHLEGTLHSFMHHLTCDDNWWLDDCGIKSGSEKNICWMHAVGPWRQAKSMLYVRLLFLDLLTSFVRFRRCSIPNVYLCGAFKAAQDWLSHRKVWHVLWWSVSSWIMRNIFNKFDHQFRRFLSL